MKAWNLHLCSSLPAPALFSVALLVLTSSGDTFPHPIPLLSSLEDPNWDVTLQQFQAALDAPGMGPSAVFEPWGFIRELAPEVVHLGLREELERSWRQQEGRRDLGENFGRQPLGTLPDSSMNLLHFQERAEEVGERKNEALHSIAGGLQAFNREKGGFGFRFGRK